MLPLHTKIASLGALGAALLAAAPAARADESGPVIIDITNPQRSLYPIALPVGGGDGGAAKTVAAVMSFDLSVAGWFRVLDPKSFLADLAAEGMSIEPQRWKDVGAYGVVKYRATGSGNQVSITFKLFEVGKGAVPVLEKTYGGNSGSVRDLTHRWCNDVVKYYTGEDGFFGSKIAFVTKRRGGGKQVLAMDFDGNGVYAVTRNSSINILPAWSPSGGKVAFTSYMRDNPDLYVVGSGGGRPVRLTKYPGMNTGASWSPDGSKIAVTLSKGGNPDIYIVSATDGSVLKQLTNSRAIDTSPAWSPDGSLIAFVSDREGGPQVFVMGTDGSGQRRVSRNGEYNTTPSWSRGKNSRVLAYTTRAEGNFDIVTLDLDSGKMVRITQGQGNNEEPSFSPNGRAIAFASSRSSGAGIYIANADGTGKQQLVYRGWATAVDWGPASR